MPAARVADRFTTLVLVLLFGVGVVYLGEELLGALARDRSELPLWRSVLLLVHLTATLPILLLPLLQFSAALRRRRPAWHRVLGRVFLSGSIVAGATAIPLGITQEGEGRGTPTVLFALLWIVFALVAWRSARRRAFGLHRQFVARAYAIAVAFIIIRVLRDTQDTLLPFITQLPVRDVTRDWLCFVLPLFAVEAWHQWWPALRGGPKTAPAPRSS